MPGDSEHPVTVGDLFVHAGGEMTHAAGAYYSSKRPATVADLVSALPDDAETIDLVVNWLWGKVANKKVKRIRKALDVLAEAQPLPPAGTESLPKDPWDYDP